MDQPETRLGLTREERRDLAEQVLAEKVQHAATVPQLINGLLADRQALEIQYAEERKAITAQLQALGYRRGRPKSDNVPKRKRASRKKGAPAVVGA
jgi:hypothetical protein